MVLVDRHNLTVKDSVRKLSDELIGPFKVVAEVGSCAYRLDLPLRMRMHNVIHVSLLKPYHGTCHNPRSPNPCLTILVILIPVTLRIS